VKAHLFHKERSKRTNGWYVQKLRAFVSWLESQGITEIEAVTTLHVRQFEVWLRSTPGRKGAISDYTVHGYIQVIKQFLRWAALEEELIPEKIAARVKMPRRGYRVIETFNAEQVRELLALAGQAREAWVCNRDQAIIAVLHDTGIRAAR
jgi:site-specific recombinase XerD